MNSADSSSSSSSRLRPQPAPALGDPGTEASPDLRIGPYFPTFNAPRREKILHPALTTAYDLDPVTRPEYHIRLHSALANADLSFPYSTGPEVQAPGPVFSSSNSRRSSTSISSSYRPSKGSRRPSTTETSVADSVAPNSSLMASIMAEIDAEIAILLDNQGRPRGLKCELETKRGWEGNSEEKPDGSEDQEMQMPEIRGLFPTPKPKISTNGIKTPSRLGIAAGSHHKMAKVSISNLRELTVAEANARVQAFKASSDYQSYQSEQKRIFDNPRRANMAAKELVAEFKRTPSWTRYATDVALILEHGDESDVAIITGSHFP